MAISLANTQNTTVFVVDPDAQTVATRSLTNQESGLTQAQIDLLSVTAAQSYQSRTYALHRGRFWRGHGHEQLHHQGRLERHRRSRPDALGRQSHQRRNRRAIYPSNFRPDISDHRWGHGGGVRITGRFWCLGRTLAATACLQLTEPTPSRFGDSAFLTMESISPLWLRPTLPATPEPNYRRANLNVVPIIEHGRQSFVAFSGAFTETFGIWTLPVEISRKGVARMTHPTNADCVHARNEQLDLSHAGTLLAQGRQLVHGPDGRNQLRLFPKRRISD